MRAAICTRIIRNCYHINQIRCISKRVVFSVLSDLEKILLSGILMNYLENSLFKEKCKFQNFNSNPKAIKSNESPFKYIFGLLFSIKLNQK